MLHNDCTVLEGGLYIKVLQMKHDDVHWPKYCQALEAAIEYEARLHNSNFEHSAFSSVIASIKADHVQAWVLLAGWDSRQLKVIGLAVEFPTVLSSREGNDFAHYHAVYMEDLALPIFMMKDLVRERPSGLSFPQQLNFSTYFVYEIYNQRLGKNPAPSCLTPVCRICEFSHLNSRMVKLLEEWGSETGSEHDGTIFEIKNRIQNNANRREFPVRIQNILQDKDSALPLPYVFLAGWEHPDHKQKIVASFTKGISTFTGETIIRAQVTGNGNLPDNDTLVSIMKSMLRAGQKEAAVRKWGGAELTKLPGAVLPFEANPPKAAEPSDSSNYQELLTESTSTLVTMPSTCEVFPAMKVHALGEPQIEMALKRIVEHGVTGIHPMRAIKHYFSDATELKIPFYVT